MQQCRPRDENGGPSPDEEPTGRGSRVLLFPSSGTDLGVGVDCCSHEGSCLLACKAASTRALAGLCRSCKSSGRECPRVAGNAEEMAAVGDRLLRRRSESLAEEPEQLWCGPLLELLAFHGGRWKEFRGRGSAIGAAPRTEGVVMAELRARRQKRADVGFGGGIAGPRQRRGSV